MLTKCSKTYWGPHPDCKAQIVIECGEIDLSNNKLTNLNPYLFKGLTKLKKLLFCNNKIESVDAALLNGLAKLQLFDMR